MHTRPTTNGPATSVSPDGSFVYVANHDSGSVSVIDAAAHTVVATVAVGDRPWNLGFTPD